MTIGERVKSRRTQLDLSVDELAQKLGKNRATVYRYENNAIENLPLSVLTPLAEALDTTPEWIMGWDSELEKMAGVVEAVYDLDTKILGSGNSERFESESLSPLLWTIKQCTSEELHFMVSYWKLNAEGRSEARKRVKELGELKQYTTDEVKAAEKELAYIKKEILPSLENFSELEESSNGIVKYSDSHNDQGE